MLLTMKHPRTIFRLAMACLALFGGLGIVHPTTMIAEDLVDAARGALLGAAITLIYLAFRLQRRREQEHF